MPFTQFRSSSGMRFKDRIQAATHLSEKLLKYKNTDGVVLAIPRGGMPLGAVVSKNLNLPLSILLSKKIGHPANKEYAIGAVTLFGLHLNENAASVSKDYLESETEKIRSNLLSRQNLFLGNKPLPSIKDKIAIIIDDGIATGETIIAGIQQLRSQEPKKIIVAVPVSAKDTAYKIAQQTDEFICLYLPEDFKGVGEFYENFEQVSDDEVIAILKEH